ncbi:Calycin-like domain and Calycin domain-containing protein [Strongyloides ratti]|uniref:Calycin-like domain and Calycin domain-containing protein n=1 Tax=Strongyloides ratti TaxID=34506 RepID=A0A090LAK5_STRRB|nr:Calycin-like domain and Calycin domain-containing protein [Strongyloides ratti]CEF66816.1 Calycin-like domain and Calycin domain-containing protein [Strongyloides ratti]
MPLNEKQNKLIGKWRLEKNGDNYGEYLDVIEIGMLKKTLALSIAPDVIINVDPNDCNKWNCSVVSPFKNKTWNYTLNNKEKDVTIDDRVFYITVTLTENGEMIEKQEVVSNDPMTGIPSIITRYVNDEGQLVAKCEAKGVTAYRYYSKVE